jgi:signal transduction histidine kinase
VIVKATGEGLEAKHLPHIFEAGYQIPGRAPLRYGGFGISLPLVKEIIEAHGGKTFAESELHKGTTLHFTLPGVEA